MALLHDLADELKKETGSAEAAAAAACENVTAADDERANAQDECNAIAAVCRRFTPQELAPFLAKKRNAAEGRLTRAKAAQVTAGKALKAAEDGLADLRLARHQLSSTVGHPSSGVGGAPSTPSTLDKARPRSTRKGSPAAVLSEGLALSRALATAK
jgi:hypothetical protein